MKLMLPLVLVALLIALYGCTHSTPSSCASLPAEKMANCAYRAAVLEENPYYCYSIQDSAQRATCIRDVGNPEVKKKLQAATQQQQEQIFSEPSSPTATPSQQAQPPTEPQPVVVQNQTQTLDCSSLSGREKDGCIRDRAVAAQQISACSSVSDAALRDSCISEIARKTKDLSSCDSLSTEDDRALCKLYAQGN